VAGALDVRGEFSEVVASVDEIDIMEMIGGSCKEDPRPNGFMVRSLGTMQETMPTMGGKTKLSYRDFMMEYHVFSKSFDKQKMFGCLTMLEYHVIDINLQVWEDPEKFVPQALLFFLR